MLSIHRLRRCWRLSTPRTERTYTWTSCEPNVWLQGPADHPGRPSQRHSPDSLGVWHAVSCVPDPASSDSCITNVHVSPTPCATLGRPWNVRGMTRARKAKHMHAGLRQSSCRAKEYSKRATCQLVPLGDQGRASRRATEREERDWQLHVLILGLQAQAQAQVPL